MAHALVEPPELLESQGLFDRAGRQTLMDRVGPLLEVQREAQVPTRLGHEAEIPQIVGRLKATMGEPLEGLQGAGVEIPRFVQLALHSRYNPQLVVASRNAETIRSGLFPDR